MHRNILFGILMVTLSCCSTIEVESKHDSEANFSDLKTFAWMEGSDKPSEDVRINNSIVIDSVRTAVENNLISKGFEKSEGTQTDFLITWFGAIEKKIRANNINHFYSTYGYGTLYHNPTTNRQIEDESIVEYEEGSLIFDFVAPDNLSLIFRAVGRDKISAGQSEKQMRQNINRAVDNILKDFPPK